MRLTIGTSLVAALLVAFIACAERGPISVVFTSDARGRLHPAG